MPPACERARPKAFLRIGLHENHRGAVACLVSGFVGLIPLMPGHLLSGDQACGVAPPPDSKNSRRTRSRGRVAEDTMSILAAFADGPVVVDDRDHDIPVSQAGCPAVSDN